MKFAFIIYQIIILFKSFFEIHSLIHDDCITFHFNENNNYDILPIII